MYAIIVHAKTGVVGHWTGYGATTEASSWKRWLENVARRLESGEFHPMIEGSYDAWDSDDYWTPGSEEKTP